MALLLQYYYAYPAKERFLVINYSEDSHRTEMSFFSTVSCFHIIYLRFPMEEMSCSFYIRANRLHAFSQQSCLNISCLQLVFPLLSKDSPADGPTSTKKTFSPNFPIRVTSCSDLWKPKDHCIFSFPSVLVICPVWQPESIVFL